MVPAEIQYVHLSQNKIVHHFEIRTSPPQGAECTYTLKFAFESPHLCSWNRCDGPGNEGSLEEP